MLFAGFAVADPSQSGTSHHLTMTGIVLAGLIGTMVGSWVAYAVGRGGRLELLERHGAKLHMGPAQIERADRFFARYGEATVLFGRMVPLVRAFVSLPAGVSKMPLGALHRVLPDRHDPVGARARACRPCARQRLDERAQGFEYVDYAIVVLAVAAIGYAVARRRSRQPSPAREDKPTADVELTPAECAARPDSRSATRSRWGCCTDRRSCCRCPPRRTPRCCHGSRAGHTSGSTPGSASPSRSRCTRARRRRCCCARRRAGRTGASFSRRADSARARRVGAGRADRAATGHARHDRRRALAGSAATFAGELRARRQDAGGRGREAGRAQSADAARGQRAELSRCPQAAGARRARARGRAGDGAAPGLLAQRRCIRRGARARLFADRRRSSVVAGRLADRRGRRVASGVPAGDRARLGGWASRWRRARVARSLRRLRARECSTPGAAPRCLEPCTAYRLALAPARYLVKAR